MVLNWDNVCLVVFFHKYIYIKYYIPTNAVSFVSLFVFGTLWDHPGNEICTAFGNMFCQIDNVCVLIVDS